MKQVIFFIGLAFCLGNVVFARGGKEMNGNGDITMSERNVAVFENILQDSNAHVRFHTSSEYRVVITTDSNLQKSVGIDVKDNSLIIGTEMLGQPKFTQFFVDVYAPQIVNVSISGSGTFEIIDTLKVSSFVANISGNGTVNGRLECETFETIISGAGNIKLEGKALISKIIITGSGNIDCFSLQTNETTVIPTGRGGNINIWALEIINAEISGDAKIIYRGDPVVNYTKHYGNGFIEKEI
jgi:hypothetical protein